MPGNHHIVRTVACEGMASAYPDLMNSHASMHSATLQQTTGTRPQESASVYPPCCMASATAFHQPLTLASVSAHKASPPLRKKHPQRRAFLSDIASRYDSRSFSINALCVMICVLLYMAAPIVSAGKRSPQDCFVVCVAEECFSLYSQCMIYDAGRPGRMPAVLRLSV